MSDRDPTAGQAPAFGLHDREFVALMAAVMALNALAIDSMLPAFPAIANSFKLVDPNRVQFLISSYLLFNALGSLIAGPLSDRFGRRPILLMGIVMCAICGLASAIAPSFATLLGVRAMHGLFASTLGVLATTIVRDRYSGDRMASVMSLVFIVFMIVPVIAPTLGQAVLAVAGWREIFHVLALGAGIVAVWTFIRLPETQHPGDRQSISGRRIARNWVSVATNKQGMGYILATGLISGGMFGFLMSAQQIFATTFNAASLFPYAFACVAGTMAIANFSNSRIVERFGARRVSHAALLAFILMGVVQLAASHFASTPLPVFLVLVALTMGMVGFTGSNFGSIAMEPFGHFAGAASSFQSFLRLAIASLVGAWTGQHFDGTTTPLAQGFLVTGILALGLVLWAEKGKLFTRPRHAALRPPNLPAT